MGKKAQWAWKILAHYKYLITIVLGVALVGFVDDNSVMRRIQYNLEISQLQDEIKKYHDTDSLNSGELRLLRQHPEAIERIAREHYFMKADDEDIFVFSTDMPATTPGPKATQEDDGTEK